MPMKVKYIYSGMKAIIKHEGYLSLFSKVYRFLLVKTFLWENYYVVGLDLKLAVNDKEVDFLPDIDNFVWKMITTNREADSLEKNGYIFGAYELNLRASLDRNVIVFCIFIDKELAHIVCLADNPKGQKTIDYRPFNVDFKNGEIATGRALTVPKFRRLHLRTYSGYLDRQYSVNKGIKWIKGTVGEYNATLIGSAKDGYLTILSRCLYIKILCFKYYKEWETDLVKPKQLLEQKRGYRDKIIKKINK